MSRTHAYHLPRALERVNQTQRRTGAICSGTSKLNQNLTTYPGRQGPAIDFLSKRMAEFESSFIVFLEFFSICFVLLLCKKHCYFHNIIIFQNQRKTTKLQRFNVRAILDLKVVTYVSWALLKNIGHTALRFFNALFFLFHDIKIY